MLDNINDERKVHLKKGITKEKNESVTTLIMKKNS